MFSMKSYPSKKCVTKDQQSKKSAKQKPNPGFKVWYEVFRLHFFVVKMINHMTAENKNYLSINQ